MRGSAATSIKHLLWTRHSRHICEPAGRHIPLLSPACITRSKKGFPSIIFLPFTLTRTSLVGYPQKQSSRRSGSSAVAAVRRPDGKKWQGAEREANKGHKRWRESQEAAKVSNSLGIENCLLTLVTVNRMKIPLIFAATELRVSASL